MKDLTRANQLRTSLATLTAVAALASVAHAAQIAVVVEPAAAAPGQTVTAFVTVQDGAATAGGDLVLILPDGVRAGSVRATDDSGGWLTASHSREGGLSIAFASATDLGKSHSALLQIPLRIDSQAQPGARTLQFAKADLCNRQAVRLPSQTVAAQLTVTVPPSDLDGDGLPDDWEIVNFGNTTSTGAGDRDRDGTSDIAEYIAGTNPNQASSVFTVHEARASGSNGPVTLTWLALQDREYTIEWTEEPLTPDVAWHEVYRPQIVAAGPTHAWTDDGTRTYALPEETHQRFYRVRVKLP